MKKNLILLLTLALLPVSAFASSVVIDPVTVVGCDAQTIHVTGSMTYSSPTETFELDLNGSPRLQDNQPVTFGLDVAFSVGSTTIYAFIDNSGVTASDTQIVGVSACYVPASSSSVSTPAPTRRKSGRRHALYGGAVVMSSGPTFLTADVDAFVQRYLAITKK